MKNLNRKTTTSVFKAANILMITMLVSRLLGYVRDVVILSCFGQNNITDAYNAGFSVPDALYMLLVGGALSSAFIPVFSSYLARNQEREGWRSVSIIFNWVMLLMVVGVTLGIIFAPQFIKVLVPGYDAETQVLTVALTRIMFFQVIFMCLAGICTGILHSYKNFSAPALGSVLYNVGTIVFGLLLMKPIEHFFPGYGIAAFSIGVVAGAFLYFFVQFLALLRIGIQYHPSFDVRDPGFRELLVLIVPVFIGLAAQQVNLLVNQNLASGLSAGLVTALRSAQRIMQLPISMFGITVGVAFFPTMSALAAKSQMSEFKSTFMMGLRSVIFVTLPAAAGMIMLRTPLIRFMYEYSSGNYTAADTAQTAYALLFYCLSIFAYSAQHTLSRACYALKNTKAPVVCSVLSIVVNVLLSIILVRPLAQGGLALAYSIAGVFNMVSLMIWMRYRIGPYGIRDFCVAFVKTTLVSLVMAAVVGLAVWGFESWAPLQYKVWQIVELVVCMLLGVAVFAGIALKLKMPEAEQVKGILLRKLRRKRPPEPQS